MRFQSLCSLGGLGRLSAAAVLALAGTAMADINGQVFYIEASNGVETGSYAVMFEQGDYNPDTGEYHWVLSEPVDIRGGRGGDGPVIATLATASLHTMDDPEVSLDFSVLAGSSNTTFSVSSALVSFAAASGWQGRASAFVGVTDTNFNGATFAPMSQLGAYRAYYNGVGGTLFSDLHDASLVAGVGGSNSRSEAFPGGGLFTPIAGVVGDISAQWRFSLSEFDLASGTSVFEIIPAPGSVALLGLGGLMAGVRRRR